MKNLLFIFLIAISSNAVSQSSFLIECTVSGDFIAIDSHKKDEKITKQKIYVTVDYVSTNLSLKFEGQRHTNFGIVEGKPLAFDSNQIYLITDKKIGSSKTVYTISINRKTGFIDSDLFFSFGNVIEHTKFSGNCDKINNPKKF